MEHKCLSPWKGAVIGGGIAFVWGALSWMVLPFHGKTVGTFVDAAPVVAALEKAAPRSGAYVLANDPKGQTAPTDPFIFVSYRKEGCGGAARAILTGLLIQCVGAFFWTWILGKIPGLTSRDAALYGAFFGLSVGALGVMPNAVWWKFPLGFSLLTVLDGVVAWTVASVAIARWGQASVCALPGKP